MSAPCTQVELRLRFGPWGEFGRLLAPAALGSCKRNCDVLGGASACDRSCGMSEERVQQLMRAAADRGGRS